MNVNDAKAALAAFKGKQINGPNVKNIVNKEEMDQAKQQGQAQLESTFPKTTKNARECRTRYIHVDINGTTYTVFGKPSYERNMSDGTYTLKSIEYTVEQGSLERANDYQNNITEHMPIKDGTKVEDLQSQFSQLLNDVKAKENQLKTLLNKISGNEDQFQFKGFVNIDSKDPDALVKLANSIEEAQEYLQELTMTIEAKRNEFIRKNDEVTELQNKSKELNARFEEKMQLYNDLCEHYEIENNINLPATQRPDKQDLDSLISFYKNYNDLQKENIAKLDEAIKTTKGKSESVNITVKKEYPDNEIGSYLSNLKDMAKSLDEKFDKTYKLYDSLCKYYGIKNHLEFPAIEYPDELTAESYEQYNQRKKEQIEKLNEEIDNLQNQNKTDADKLSTLFTSQKSFFHNFKK